MLKKIIVTSLATFTLLMSGCGGDSEGESYLETQQMLDKGDFTGVISKLESSASSDDDYLTLGAAYMGKAGFSLSNVIGALADSDNFGGGEIFANYTKNVIGDDTSPTAFSDLRKANIYYTKVVGGACVSNAKVLTSSEKDICLYIGLALTTTASTTISLLADNLDSFGNDNIVDTKLEASACAMQYAVDPSQVNSACTISRKSGVTFTQSQKTYGRIGVLVNGESNDFLLTSNNKTILTVGYCPNDDFSKRVDEKEFGYYPCPINEAADSDEVTTGSVLVDTLNDGLGLITTVAPSDVQEEADKMKCDIVGGFYNGNSCSNSGSITEQNVIDYLINNN